MQLEAISSLVNNTVLLAATSFQVAVESYEVSPQPFPLQTKQLQFPQLFLITLVFCAILFSLHSTAEQLDTLFVENGPQLSAALEVQSRHRSVLP